MVHLATFLLKVANLNFVSDLSSYFNCRGLKVLMEARILQWGKIEIIIKLFWTHGFQKTFISRRICGSSPFARFRKLLSFRRIHFLSPFLIHSSGTIIWVGGGCIKKGSEQYQPCQETHICDPCPRRTRWPQGHRGYPGHRWKEIISSGRSTYKEKTFCQTGVKVLYSVWVVTLLFTTWRDYI